MGREYQTVKRQFFTPDVLTVNVCLASLGFNLVQHDQSQIARTSECLFMHVIVVVISFDCLTDVRLIWQGIYLSNPAYARN